MDWRQGKKAGVCRIDRELEKKERKNPNNINTFSSSAPLITSELYKVYSFFSCLSLNFNETW
jgi:hypothetical protein